MDDVHLDARRSEMQEISVVRLTDEPLLLTIGGVLVVRMPMQHVSTPRQVPETQTGYTGLRLRAV